VQSCGDFHDEVSRVCARAWELLQVAERSLPADEVQRTVARLVAADGYGTRRSEG
jgi:hypothetical protein